MNIPASQTIACPACTVAPSAKDLAEMSQTTPDIGQEISLYLSLPTIYCAACITAVEQKLSQHPAIRMARVNLTLKRVAIITMGHIPAQDFITMLADIGYEAYELDPGMIRATSTDSAGQDILMRLAVAGFAMMNIMLLSVAVWSGAEGVTRDLFHWISALIAFPTIAFSGKPFFTSAWSALSVRRLNMDVPISLAILLALGTSLYETMHSGHHAYFDAAVSLTFFLLTGRYLDYRTRAVARSAAEELAALEVPRAIRVTEGQEETVPISDIRSKDLVRVLPGARFPVDGIILEGASEIDASLLTGESTPIPVAKNDMVSAGETNLTGPLLVQVTAAGQESSLHRMTHLVAMAESGRNRYTSLADRAAKLYAPGVHILAALSFVGWYLYSQDLRISLNIAAAVLIITCPCALGLAVPAVTTAASGRLFQRGLLIKDATALERLGEVDTIVFDKTGTLTQGTPKALNLDTLSDTDLALLLALARISNHPLAQAITKQVSIRDIPPPPSFSALKEIPGFGIEGCYNDQIIRLGRGSWVGAQDRPYMASWLAVGDRPPIEIRFQDRLRIGADIAVATLCKMGFDIHLLSGDNATTTQQMAETLGITHWQAAIQPEGKAAKIQQLEDEGRKVLMLGDGLNDTLALTKAHVSISPATALDAARVASDIVLLGNDLSALPVAIKTARKATLRIRENFRIATLYNIIAVPIAIAGFATPLAAALAMSASSITVSLNALRLR